MLTQLDSPSQTFGVFIVWQDETAHKLQVGDILWSLHPGATALAATPMTDVRRVAQTGFVSLHTLQGEHWLLVCLVLPAVTVCRLEPADCCRQSSSPSCMHGLSVRMLYFSLHASRRL